MTGHKIMIVEDDAEIRDIIRLYLEKNGYSVIMAESGDEALAMAPAEQPDLFILDVLCCPGKAGLIPAPSFGRFRSPHLIPKLPEG
ncbi:response regulator [Paenibacillus sp. P25]|nr:response regulator [Paenibacillus sp. P25]